MIKITKEQYNRVFASKLISENHNKEKGNGLKSECVNLIKYMYGKKTDSPNQMIYDEVCKILLEKGIIIEKDGHYEISKKLGTPENAKEILEAELKKILAGKKDEMDEMSNYPPGVEPHTSDAPWNQPDNVGEPKKEPRTVALNNPLQTVGSNDEISILTDGPNLYVMLYGDLSEVPLKDDVVNKYVSTHKNEIGYGFQDWDSGHKRIVQIDPELKNDLMMMYDKDRNIVTALNSAENIDEMTASGSAGAFTGPLSGPPVKRDLNTANTPVVAETTSASPSTVGPYDANALPNIKRDGTYVEGKKTKAEKKTQWAGGSFVSFDDCTKLNNNKTAQKGGCSQGAVDHVVKQKKTSGNINAPSLHESIMREALKLQHDRAQNKLIVLSDLEGRAASQETFRNKALLKQNGFNWDGAHWSIPADQLEVAKTTLSLVNKVDYIIDSLEDVEEAVATADDQTGTDAKSLVKARVEQYINDLANATDEAALSAEIRRYLTFFSKFHSYSFYNRMLIYIQRPDATKVASYKTWQSKYRQVNKGAKGITVLAPIISKSKAPESPDDEELTSSSDVRGFRAVNVFDISDTSSTDERGEIPVEPQWWGENTPSETADMLFGAVSEVAADLGIKITQSDASGGEKGFSAGDHINISSDVSGAARLSTMIHEIAHELMHWKKSSIFYTDNGEGQQKRQLQELQAESVSYVVLKHYGIPVAHHPTYLVLWKANKERIQSNLEVISKVSQFIIDKIDKQVNSQQI